MKFTYEEFKAKSIAKGCTEADFTPEIDANVRDLVKRITALGYKPPMYFSSCLRSKEWHKQIYLNKGVSEDKIPWGSSHLSGKAADISDPDGKLAKWLLENENKLSVAGLWCEHPNYTKGWCHLQSVPPKSGKRFFIP